MNSIGASAAEEKRPKRSNARIACKVDQLLRVSFQYRRKTGRLELEAIVLTAVGQVEMSRPYYLCSHCHAGQFPADMELDIAGHAVEMDGTGAPVVKRETVVRPSWDAHVLPQVPPATSV